MIRLGLGTLLLIFAFQSFSSDCQSNEFLKIVKITDGYFLDQIVENSVTEAVDGTTLPYDAIKAERNKLSLDLKKSIIVKAISQNQEKYFAIKKGSTADEAAIDSFVSDANFCEKDFKASQIEATIIELSLDCGKAESYKVNSLSSISADSPFRVGYRTKQIALLQANNKDFIVHKPSRAYSDLKMAQTVDAKLCLANRVNTVVNDQDDSEYIVNEVRAVSMEK